LLPEKQAKEVVKAFDSLYALWVLLEQSSHNVNEVKNEYPKRIERYVESCMAALKKTHAYATTVFL
jgi:hypothetical protein